MRCITTILLKDELHLKSGCSGYDNYRIELLTKQEHTITLLLVIEMNQIVKAIKDKFLEVWKVADGMARGKAIETIEYEAEELDHIFGILVLASFVGLPSPPMQISLDLMPLMEQELMLMMEKVDTAHEPISDLFSVFDIG